MDAAAHGGMVACEAALARRVLDAWGRQQAVLLEGSCAEAECSRAALVDVSMRAGVSGPATADRQHKASAPMVDGGFEGPLAVASDAASAPSTAPRAASAAQPLSFPLCARSSASSELPLPLPPPPLARPGSGGSRLLPACTQPLCVHFLLDSVTSVLCSASQDPHSRSAPLPGRTPPALCGPRAPPPAPGLRPVPPTDSRLHHLPSPCPLSAPTPPPPAPALPDAHALAQAPNPTCAVPAPLLPDSEAHLEQPAYMMARPGGHAQQGQGRTGQGPAGQQGRASQDAAAKQPECMKAGSGGCTLRPPPPSCHQDPPRQASPFMGARALEHQPACAALPPPQRFLPCAVPPLFALQQQQQLLAHQPAYTLPQPQPRVVPTDKQGEKAHARVASPPAHERKSAGEEALSWTAGKDDGQDGGHATQAYSTRAHAFELGGCCSCLAWDRNT